MPSVVATLDRPAPDRALAHRLALGLEGYASSLNGHAYGLGGLSLAYTVAAHVALGMNHLAWARSSGREAVTAGPFVEASWFPRAWLQPFAQAGVPVQVRWGNGLPAAVGVAPFAGAGLRFWIGGRVSVGVGARVLAVATDGYLAWAGELRKGAVSFAGGLECGGHL
jgi:hypothetical protein